MLEKLNDITELSPRVIRILGQNGSPFTLQGTNCYLVGTGKKRVLIDTGSGLRAFLSLISMAMQQSGVIEIEAIIITHHHIDHIGGIKSLKPLLSEGCIIYMKDIGPVWRDRKKVEYCGLYDGQLIRTEGTTLEVWIAPGHTSDSICLWMTEERALFSGDSILGEGKSPVLDDLYSYFESMHTLLAKIESYSQPVIIYPGHGQIIKDGFSVVKLAISKRESRNQEILNLLNTKPWSTVEQITNEVYRKVPPELRIAAIGTVKRHLKYLVQIGKVIRRTSEEDVGQYNII